MTRVAPTSTDHPLVGKRINHAGYAATVTHVNDGIAWVAYDDFATPGVVLEAVAADLPELVARASFERIPCDRGGA